MKKRLSTILLSFLLSMVLLATTISNSYAQELGAAGEVTLADLGKSEITLNGPFDTSSVTFGLPADWGFTGDAKIDLNVTTTFSSLSQTDANQSLGGTLVVSFNRTTVATLILDKIGTFDYPINVPVALLSSLRTDGLMELRFTLNSGISCVANQRMNVIINTSTRASFPYEEKAPDTALINFPRPIIQSSIFPDQALVVIPDEPSAMELQSAFTVASGLGNLSSSSLGLELITISQLSDAQKASAHLIFIGKASSIPIIAELPLSLAVQSGAFVFPDGSEDNGVIQLVNSPWSVRNVALVVSGNTDIGTLRAAQAVSTGIFQENTSPNLAIVENIQDAVAPLSMITDQSFGDLGYAAQQFNNRGVDSQSYNFYFPTGNTLSSDAYLELAFGHSSLLDYNVSGIVVLLNSQPIGSVRFDDVTAGQAINRIKVSIPASVVLPGDNRVEIRASLEPLDSCADPNLRGLWAVIWPDSRLHLPFTTTQLSTEPVSDLSEYPAPMIFDSTLGTTAVITKRDDVEAWRSFIHVASYLGDRSNGSITKLGVFFDDELSGADLTQYNLIVIGRPSQLTVMGELNTVLPVPFEAGSDITQNKFQVTYQIPPEVPIGYLELMPSPWNSEKVVIAALGNTDTGVNWGVSALVDSTLRSQLGGDFAVINNTRVQTIDTRLVQPLVVTPVVSDPSGISTPIPAVTPVTPAINRPAWLLPVLILSIILIIVIIGVAIVTNSRNTRKK